MEAEQLKHFESAVLGICFQDEGAISQAKQYLDENCFTDNSFRGIWQVMCQLEEQGVKIDIDQVYYGVINNKIAIDRNTLELLSSLGDKDNLVNDAKILIEERNKRDYVALSNDLDERLAKGELKFEEVQATLANFLEKKTPLKNNVVDLFNSIIDLKGMLDDNKKENKELEGTPTGFKELDKTNGFHKGEFIVIAGASSHGKTSLALSITLHALKKKARIAYYSLEMNHLSLTARLMAMESRVPASDMLYKKLSDEQYSAVMDAMHNKQIPLKRLFYDDSSSSSFETITSSLRAMKRQYKIDGAFIDYLQILNVNSKSRDTQERIMADVARKFKNLAIELDIWIVALSQLNRDKDNPQPRLDRIRDSGQIVEAADVVIFVYRPELYSRKYDFEYKDMSTENTAMIEIAKGRNIGICKFFADFEPELTHFTYHEPTEEERTKIGENRQAKSRGAALSDAIKEVKGKPESSNPQPIPQYTPPKEEDDLPFAPPNENDKPPY